MSDFWDLAGPGPCPKPDRKRREGSGARKGPATQGEWEERISMGRKALAKGAGMDYKRLLMMTMVIAVPVALQNLLTTTGSMVDTIMLSSLGENTVGAVGLCAQFSNLMFSGYWGFVGGGMLFFSQFWGAGDGEGIRLSYRITMAFMMVVGFGFSLAAVFFPSTIMGVYTGSPVIREIGTTYLRIVGFSYPLQVFAVAMSALLRSIEQVRIPLYGGIAAVVTNCACNYILIFGRLGLPALGVRGAALGTVLGALVNVLVVVILSLRRRIPYVLEIFRAAGKREGLLSEYLQKSAPILANELLIGVGNMLISIVLGHQVEEAIAAVAVFRTLEGIVISFFSGFSNASTVLVGREVGAGHHEEAFKIGRALIYFCSAFIAVIVAGLNLIRSPLLHTLGLSGRSYEFACGMLLIYGVISIFRMGNWAQNDTYRCAGDPAFGSTLEIVFMFLMVQPAIFLASGPLRASFLVVFALCYSDELIRYVLMQRHLYSRKWIRPVSREGLRTIGEFRERYNVGRMDRFFP